MKLHSLTSYCHAFFSSRQGDSSSYVYVVLNGRFREVHTNIDGSRTVIGESGRGAFLGYVEVTSAKPRMNTALAIR